MRLFDSEYDYSNLRVLDMCTLHRLQSHSDIVIPKALQFSEDAHVLLQTDLGQLIPVADWLCHVVPPPPDEDVCHIGRALGRFLGSLHGVTTNLSAEKLRVTRDHFANRDVDRMLFERTVRPLRTAFQRCNVSDVQGFDMNTVCDTLERRWQQFDNGGPEVSLTSQALAHGDMWYANVFLMPNRSPDCEGRGTRLSLAVIDWEFCAVTRVGLDLARFCTFSSFGRSRVP